MTHGARLLGGALGASLALMASAPAMAGGCCMSATATGVGRLMEWEDFAVGLFESAARTMGTWDSDGEWWPEGESSSDTEWTTELWGLVRVDERWSLLGRVPWRWTVRRAGDLGDEGGGLGDAQLGARWDAVRLGESRRWPGIALTGGVLAPTGRTTEDSEGALAADATGRGAWVLSAGLSVEKTLLPWFVRVDAGASLPLPQERGDLAKTQRFGPGGTAALTGGLEVLDDVLVASAFLRYAAEGAVTLDDDELEGSDRAGSGLGAALAWRASPHWTVQSALDTDVFIAGLGDNQAGRLAVTLGLRYGHF